MSTSRFISHDQRGEQHGQTKDQEIVAVERAFDEPLAQPGYLEDRFHYEGAGDDPGQRGAEKGNRRDQPALEAVFPDDGDSPTRPWRARCARNPD